MRREEGKEKGEVDGQKMGVEEREEKGEWRSDKRERVEGRREGDLDKT